MVRAEQDGENVLIWVKLVPGASRDEIVGDVGDRLKVRVSAPPEEGRANQATCALLARAVDVKAKDVNVESGHTNPKKIIRICGATLDDVKAALTNQ